TESPLPHYTIRRVTYGYHRFKRHLAPLYLKRALQAFRPDVVHFQAPHKGLYGGVYGEPLFYLFRWLRRQRIPTLITLHSLWLREDFLEMAQERGQSARMRKVLETLYARYFRRLLTLATQANALVSGDTNPLIAEFQQEWGLERFTIHAEAHPCAAFEFQASDTAVAKASIGLDGKRLVLAFGFVRPDKGFHYLMEAVAPLLERDSNLLLLIAGNPRGVQGERYAQQLRDLHTRLGKSSQIRLEFGYLPDERMHAYLRACDVLVVPYTRVMGASGPMHHALSYGKPVVATAVGQNRGLADVCALVPPRDPKALRDALEPILYEPEVWQRYHQQAAQYAASHTWGHLAQRYYADYERLIQEGRRS
ncbi:MAG: glycosyltransferase, partial [Fimbriimonadales bacterium]